MMYNLNCLDEQITGALCFPEAASTHFSQFNVVGKAPSTSGLTVPAVRLGNGSSARGGRFAMKKTEYTCPTCGKKFLDYTSENRKFCSTECRYEGSKTWTREHILDAIREISVDGVANSNKGHKSLNTVARRTFGSWAKACAVAGVASPKTQNEGLCSADGCENPPRSATSSLCEKHYYRLRRNNSLETILPKYELNESVFDSLSQDNTWLLGYIWSDGNIAGNRISITSKDLDVLMRAETVLSGKNLIRERENPRRHWALAFVSRRIANALRAFGLHESKSLDVDWPIGLPPDFEWSFVRGLFDGDGWVSLRKLNDKSRRKTLVFGICSGSNALISELSRFLQGEDIRFSSHERKPKQEKEHSFYKVTVAHQGSLKKIYEMFYPSPDIPFLARKFELFNEWYSTH